MAATMKAMSATPPMATPAMPPVLRALESEDPAAAPEDSVGEGDDFESVIVVGPGAELEVSEGEDEDVPSIVMLVYASQSELGTANGHVGSWHIENSWGGCFGFSDMAGAQRVLYRLFMSRANDCASVVEKPWYSAERVSWLMKCPISVKLRLINLWT